MARLTVTAAAALSLLLPAMAQTPKERQPMYKVTIVSRTTKAVNYGHRTTPTKIDFKGTPLLSDSRGEASVNSERGTTIVDAKFSHLPPPTRFGPQYLTYVVWAISPDGRPQNLGELQLDPSDKAKLTASTMLQTFAMIVTAEPHYSVSQPSDVVVMENVVSSGTIGKVEEVNATYELLPRNQFTYDTASAAVSSNAKPVSRDEYDAIVALYQAQNAIQIAESQDAAKYAGERLSQARQLYNQAKGYPKNLSKEIVSMAKEATQIAEDARLVAVKRAQSQRAADEQQRVAEAQIQSEMSRSRATEVQQPAPPRPAPAPRATAPVVSSPPPAPQPQASSRPAIEVDHNQFHQQPPNAKENRARLVSTLRGMFETRDTPRGVVVILSEPLADSRGMPEEMRRLAAVLQPYRNLHLEVQGHSDLAGSSAATQRRAELVRQGLIAGGLSPDIILARGYGNTQLLAANDSAEGRAQNRRVEIVIAGDEIGSVATWDRTYSVTPGGR